MATGGDWTLDDSTIAQLAADISINDMVTVVESYMKISPEKIKNLRDENRGSAEAVNREILRTWIYRFPGPHHRLVCANHTVIIIGGSNWAPAMHPLCRSNFFRFHACFAEKWPNNIVSQPFLELAPPPLGNPGSATDHRRDKNTRCSAYNAYFSRYRSHGFELQSL